MLIVTSMNYANCILLNLFLLVAYGDIYANQSLALNDSHMDGIGTDARMITPEHLYQTQDKKRMMFVDYRRCVRERDKATIISPCKKNTLGLYSMGVLYMV